MHTHFYTSNFPTLQRLWEQFARTPKTLPFYELSNKTYCILIIIICTFKLNANDEHCNFLGLFLILVHTDCFWILLFYRSIFSVMLRNLRRTGSRVVFVHLRTNNKEKMKSVQAYVFISSKAFYKKSPLCALLHLSGAINNTVTVNVV